MHCTTFFFFYTGPLAYTSTVTPGISYFPPPSTHVSSNFVHQDLGIGRWEEIYKRG